MSIFSGPPKTGGDVLVETLIKWGVDKIFGIPGDGINGVFESLRQNQSKIRFVQARHEEAAAFMACGYAKFTGKLGVCIATSGPGGIHLLNGLYDAKLDGQPVLAITGLQFHDVLGTYGQQDVALDKAFSDVAAYNERIMGPDHVESVTELAIRKALANKTVSHITIPVDFQSMPVTKSERSERNVAHHVSHVNPVYRHQPASSDLTAAAEILNAGEKIVILAGRGALHATDELIQTAEILGAPIIKALLGKASVPDDSPYTIGGIGLLGTLPSQEAMESCDTLLIVGSSFPYMEFMPKPGQARCVQIDDDPARLSLRYPVERGLVGDTKMTLESLIPMLKRNEKRTFLETAQSGMKKWQERMVEQATRTDSPMKPQVVAHELGLRLPDNAIVTCDSGTITTWWARHIPVRRGQMHSVSGNLASMACGLPYAIGAAIAFPERPVYAFIGDGSASMLMGEFATLTKYKLNVKVFIIKNNTLGQIKWEQMVFLGNPEYQVDLQPIDFATVAQGCGVAGATIVSAEQCGSDIARILATEGPVIVQAVVDPFEPPMPAKITLKQAAHFAASLARGEPSRMQIALTVAKDGVRELI